MLEINDYNATGFMMAILGMRNALSSWDKSDSYECRLGCVLTDSNLDAKECNFICGDHFFRGYVQIGPADMKLAKKLIKAGSSDRKFMRMIHVQVDVIAPLYFWKEADQYKVGTTTNSCSTMHKIHSKPITMEDFSIDDVRVEDDSASITLKDCFENVVSDCETLRKKFIDTKDRRYWKALIQLLPESYNQLRTWDLDYETLLNIYFQRRNHKLDEWHTFCDWIKTLPYMSEFIGALEENKSK